MDCKELDTTLCDLLHTHTHGLQHTRPPCPSPTPGACSDSCPLKSVMPSNHLILCCPLLLLPSIFPSTRAFSNQSAHQVAKVLKFQHQSFQWIFRVDFLQDWFDLLAVQGTLKSPLAPVQKQQLSALSLLYGLTLTFVHDYWKNQFWLGRPLLAKWCLCFIICCIGWL